jgi:hypothetical protein
MPVLLANGEPPPAFWGIAPPEPSVPGYPTPRMECPNAEKQEAAGDLEHGADQLLPVRSLLGSCQFEEVEGRLVLNPPMSRVQHH